MVFAVDAFTSPGEALDHKPGYYDMLITDIRMFVITGFEASRRVRDLDSEV